MDTMTVDLDRIGAESAETERSWDAPACALYALALGAGFDQPAFVAGREVYPTFVMSLSAAEAATWPDAAFATGDFDLHRVVLGQQSLLLHAPVEPTGRVRMRTRVASILDKGSGALITLETIAVDAETDDDAFTSASSLFVIGEGGFGGDRGPASAPVVPPDRAPDAEVAVTTSPVQSLLYRHAGNDDNPVHVDPAFARAAGFDGPILTGQNTLGFACRAVVETVAGGDARRVRSIEGRFGKPAYNGDVLTTRIWTGRDAGTSDHEDTVTFTVSTQRDEVVVDRGLAILRPAAPERA
jgi:acyl dehydratase